MRNLSQLFSLSIVLCILFFQTSAKARPPEPSRPKLLVVIAIDQFRSDYLTRYEKFFLPAMQANGAPGGFRYFMEKGAYFTNSKTAHAENVTAVGHATMLTGAFPYLHGIVANAWYDRDLKKSISATFDPNALIVGTTGVLANSNGISAKNLLVTTLGDEMKNSWNGKPTVVSVALKDRASVFMAGHRADLALWYNAPAKYRGEDQTAGAEWVSSTYYLPSKHLPDWLVQWNKSNYIEKHAPKTWEKLLPEKAYSIATTLLPEFLGSGRGLGKSFPHPVRGSPSAFVTSPWGNQYILETALLAVKQMKLGNHEVPDLLAVSLSSFDALGHNFGPVSVEMMDATLRVDRMLADFLSQLQKMVPGGLSNVTIALTADHGIQLNPSYVEQLKLPGGPYSSANWVQTANSALSERFGFSKDESPVLHFTESSYYLDHELIQRRGKDVNEVARGLAEWLRRQPFVAAAYAQIDLSLGNVAPTGYSRKMAVNTFPTRTGDVFISNRPGYITLLENTSEGADHESPSVQDASVPIILVGQAFKPGHYAEEVYLNDLAPTLSHTLGIVAPTGSEGHVLAKALR
jgi:hypothetical protein